MRISFLFLICFCASTKATIFKGKELKDIQDVITAQTAEISTLKQMTDSCKYQIESLKTQDMEMQKRITSLEERLLNMEIKNSFANRSPGETPHSAASLQRRPKINRNPSSQNQFTLRPPLASPRSVRTFDRSAGSGKEVTDYFSPESPYS